LISQTQKKQQQLKRGLHYYCSFLLAAQLTAQQPCPEHSQKMFSSFMRSPLLLEGQELQHAE
jgi:hypothetical protein